MSSQEIYIASKKGEQRYIQFHKNYARKCMNPAVSNVERTERYKRCAIAYPFQAGTSGEYYKLLVYNVIYFYFFLYLTLTLLTFCLSFGTYLKNCS